MNIGPNIDLNNLEYYLDSANIKSYPGTGTVWTDITSYSKTATLVSGMSYDTEGIPSIEADGSTGYVDLGQTLNYTSGDFSFIGWFKPLSTTSNKTDGNINTLPLFYKGGYNYNGYYLTITATGYVAFYTSQYNSAQSTLGLYTPTFSLNTWYNYAITRSGSVVNTYINGVNVTALYGTHIDPDSSSDNFIIGSYQPYSYNITWAHEHSQFLAYSKKLTDEEILKNYEAVKFRYI